MSDTEETKVSAPSQFLSEITRSKVIVKLYSGEEYHGMLYPFLFLLPLSLSVLKDLWDAANDRYTNPIKELLTALMAI
jgi:small nuclear ribonucleoprotein (snRNP)-like protein